MSRSPEGVGLLILGFALALLGVGLTAGDFPLATALGAGGTVLAVVGAALVLVPSVRVRRPPEPLPVGAPIVGLRDALRSGPLGRQRIVAAIVSLDRRTGGPGGTLGMNPDEERRLIALEPAAFRAWLDGQLDRLERDA